MASLATCDFGQIDFLRDSGDRPGPYDGASGKNEASGAVHTVWSSCVQSSHLFQNPALRLAERDSMESAGAGKTSLRLPLSNVIEKGRSARGVDIYREKQGVQAEGNDPSNRKQFQVMLQDIAPTLTGKYPPVRNNIVLRDDAGEIGRPFIDRH